METTKYATVHSFAEAQESAYLLPIPINDSWDWSMHDHIKTTILYKNSQLISGNPGGFKPIKNITRPILNLQYRAEGFDVKDIVLFVSSPQNHYKSFLVRKFHEKWARENNIDTFIDQLVESYVDFGGALAKNINDVKPEIVPLQSIAFCDQTDLLSGPIGIKHFYSPDQLLAMVDRGWGDTKNGATCTLEEAILLSREEKENQNQDQTDVKTPGKYIEVYEIHGNLPKRYLNNTDTSGKYENQMHIICFYSMPSGKKGHITLFNAAEPVSPFKFISRDGIYGRALGMGGAEELFEAQTWTNSDVMRKQDMLEAASKTILKATGTSGSTIANKNKMRSLDNLSIIDVGPDGDLSQIDTFPRNAKLFEEDEDRWQSHAQQTGSANDSIQGKQPTSGTPFKLQELVTQESHSIHEYRKGKLAVFVDEIYRDWVIPHIVKELMKGQEFLAELDLDELQYVSDAIVTCQTNDMIKRKVLAGELIDPNTVEGYKQIVRGEFKKRGTKHFISILQGEMKHTPVDVETNIAGKQKNLSEQVDKLTNVFRTIVANPYILQSPPIAQLFNKIIEASGLDPIDLSNFNVPSMPTRRMTETINYADLPPDAQQAMLKTAGIEVQPQQQTQPLAANQPANAPA